MFKQYILPGIVAAGLIFGTAAPGVGAQNSKPAQTAKHKGQAKQTRPAKKSKTTGGSVKAQNTAGGIRLTADAAVLIDAETGQLLFDKQADKKRPPASTTKIMTTILALEYGNVADIVTVSDKAGRVGQASIYLDPGERLTLGNLIEGAMIKSGNDACVAIAEHIAGSEEMFVKMMNAKAKTLGAYNTHFTNTNGLPNSNHFSTAYDLALMARYGMRLPRFAEITRTKEAEIEFVEPQSALPVRNTNKLLWMYEFADGVKTGTTNAAGKCLVSSATKNGRQLIAVVLNSPGRFTDSMKLLEYGFNHFQPVKLGAAGDEAAKFPVLDGAATEVPAIMGEAVEFLAAPGDLEKVERKVVWSRPHTAPVRAGESLGEIQFWLKGKMLGQAPLYSGHAIKRKGLFNRFVSDAKLILP